MDAALAPASILPLADRIDTLLSHSQIYPCILLVHTEVASLTRAASQLEAHTGWPRLSIGSRLSEQLLPIPPRQRPLSANRIVRDLAGSMAPGPILCVDVDLLFEPGLALDPLQLLKECSRQTALVVLWPGEYRERVLAYAVPEHGHYRAWRQTGLSDQCIIAL